MRRYVAATFFLVYLVTLGVWPSTRWWYRPTNFMVWGMYSGVNGGGGGAEAIDVGFRDGRIDRLPSARKPPYLYLYRPGEGPAPDRGLGENALVGLQSSDTPVADVARRICAALPGAEAVTLTRGNGARERQACLP